MTEQPTDFEVLFPDVALTLSTGESVTVREFRYLEGIRAAGLARPILDRLRQLHAEATSTPALIETLLIEHWEAWSTLLCIVCDRDRAWLEHQGDQDGMALTMAFWQANSGFFLRRLAWTQGMGASLEALVAILCRSPNSSTAWSPGAMDATPPNSADD